MNFAVVPDKVQQDSKPYAGTYEEILERMMAQYGTTLLRMAYLYLRDASLAEDAVRRRSSQ